MIQRLNASKPCWSSHWRFATVGAVLKNSFKNGLQACDAGIQADIHLIGVGLAGVGFGLIDWDGAQIHHTLGLSTAVVWPDDGLGRVAAGTLVERT